MLDREEQEFLYGVDVRQGRTPEQVESSGRIACVVFLAFLALIMVAVVSAIIQRIG